ncbi:MAG: hypothetical protein K2X09_07070, partial [Rickettsiales bacterium]|nr:hypothetical protein [Rickettsiales bacterium]
TDSLLIPPAAPSLPLKLKTTQHSAGVWMFKSGGIIAEFKNVFPEPPPFGGCGLGNAYINCVLPVFAPSLKSNIVILANIQSVTLLGPER